MESFAQALLSLDLDTIKTFLKSIIQQNRVVIENQLKQIALQEESIRLQEDALLQMEQQGKKAAKQQAALADSLADIRSDLKSASDSARIAASNVEACAWIALAEYIK